MAITANRQRVGQEIDSIIMVMLTLELQLLSVSLPVYFPVEGLDERIHYLYRPRNLVLLQSVG